MYLTLTIINHIEPFILMTDNFIDDAAKKLKNSQQDAKAEAETAQDHAEGFSQVWSRFMESIQYQQTEVHDTQWLASS